MIWMWAGGSFVAAAAVVAWWWLRRRFLVVTVLGISMSPAYRDGDRVLVRRVLGGPTSAGQVVVADLPTQVERDVPRLPSNSEEPVVPAAAAAMEGGLLELRWSRVVKRVAAVAGDRTPAGVRGEPVVPAGMLVLLGDNRSASSDSRHYGYVPVDAVIGIVVRSLR